eukprot:2191650-Alexandrium_andersonii.AAC.1
MAFDGIAHLGPTLGQQSKPECCAQQAGASKPRIAAPHHPTRPTGNTTPTATRPKCGGAPLTDKKC